MLDAVMIKRKNKDGMERKEAKNAENNDEQRNKKKAKM